MKRLAILALVLLVACTPARRKVRGDVVRKIEFSGNGGAFSGHNDYQLAKQMVQEDTAIGLTTWPLNLFVQPKVYRPSVLVRDAYRLEIWYAHHGWLDAKVTGFVANRARRSTRRKAGVIDLKGTVDVGPQSMLRKLEIEGADGAAKLVLKSAMRTGPIQQGDPFNLDLVEGLRQHFESQLQRNGYPYAKVKKTTDAYPKDRAVDVVLIVEEGISARYGAMTIEGDKDVQRRFIDGALKLKPGDPYRSQDLVAAQNRLFGLDTFSVATVRPDLSDPTQPVVPLKVKLTESRFRTLRFGVGLKAEGAVNWEPYVSAKFRHSNFIKRLVKLDFGVRVGLAGYSPVSTNSNPTPVASVTAAALVPQVLHPTLSQQLEVEIKRDQDVALQTYFNPEADLRTIWRPSDTFLATAGPHVEQLTYVDLEEGSVAEERAKIIYGEDFERSYRITSIDLGVTLDWRDDKINTHRGSMISATSRLAFPIVSGDYAFGAFSADWRLFRPLKIGDRIPITFATRVHGEWIVPFGDSKLPYPELVFFGGASDMRGYPVRAMGPYNAFVPPPDPVTGRQTRTLYAPIGGTIGTVVSQEVRFDGAFGVTYAMFVDAATLANPGRTTGISTGIFTADLLEGFRFAGGVGMRYQSAIGPLRVDLAMRPYYASDDCGPVTEPRACESGGASQRRMDIIRTFDRDSKWPALMVFIAFGEAI